MNYLYLPAQLAWVADAAAQFFKDNRGVQKFQVEKELVKWLRYGPTLHSVALDQYYFCIEVLPSPFSPTLESVVSDCMQQSLPVKLFVAFPGGPNIPDYKSQADRARLKGVGVLEVTTASCQVIHEALSLSLIGVRPIDKKSFPPKYRQALSDAEATFRNGSPAKGCAIIYDEIEGLSRRIAIKTRAKGFWKAPPAGSKPGRIKLDKGNWEPVIEAVMEHLDWNKCGYLKRSLRRVLSITPHRNESGHKPKTLAALVRREKELKTRFENAVDILSELIVASRPLRV
jgi:hypothetical protein